MGDQNKDAAKRESKRLHMRQSLDASFGDPLEGFKTPIAARQISKSIDDESAELEGRIRKISDSSDELIGDGEERTTTYINQRQAVVDAVEKHINKARRILSEERTQLLAGPRRNELKRALRELDESDSMLLNERTALAAHRIRVKYSVLGHPSNVKIGEAYLMAITENLPEPAEASYRKKHARASADQTSFRNRLIKAYNAKGSKILETQLKTPTVFLKQPEIWCPVAGETFKASEMKAAHIVPYSIGETNAAYLFGSEVSAGYDVLWSESNGLMMNEVLEEIFDDGRMVIIPDPADKNEFISIILSQALLKDSRLCPAIDAPYSALHKRRLQFQTGARPGKRYLYMHALLSLFRRRRFDVPGWEKDRQQIFTGQIWATPSKWARRSMIQAIALEYGDVWEGAEAVSGLGEFEDAMSPEQEKGVAIVVRYAWENRAGKMEDDDDDDGDDGDDGDDDEKMS